jgi:hypothetical protein
MYVHAYTGIAGLQACVKYARTYYECEAGMQNPNSMRFTESGWPLPQPSSPRKRESISDAGTSGYMGPGFRGDDAAELFNRIPY